VEKKYISDEVLKSLETWRKDPANWTP
ncbi:MAG TPA: orotate phosphoribosyltransferase, partial [Algoriphagus sp.]|nr:orotate phosphoribosyltransferase [Algoriphagus sp.]